MATCAVFRFSSCNVSYCTLIFVPGREREFHAGALIQAKGLKGLVYLARAARGHPSAPGLLLLLLLFCCEAHSLGLGMDVRWIVRSSPTTHGDIAVKSIAKCIERRNAWRRATITR